MLFFYLDFVLFFFTGQYLNLDKDHNGMLSKEELSRYGTATLTSVFLDRVFQECLTYDGEMVQSVTITAVILRIVVAVLLGNKPESNTSAYSCNYIKLQEKQSIISCF